MHDQTLDIEKLAGAESKLKRILEFAQMMIYFRGQKRRAFLVRKIFVFIQNLEFRMKRKMRMEKNEVRGF